MAAQNGTAILTAPNRAKWGVSVYASDVSGVSIKWSKDGKADANAPDYISYPFYFGIEDISFAAAPATPTGFNMKVDDVFRGIYQFAQHLPTVVNRPALDIVVAPNQRLTSYQVA